MNVELYNTIYKRKSFHLFRNVGNEKITDLELKEIKEAYSSFDTLYSDIKTSIRIVPASKVNFKRDAEYCILIYSETKDNYLMNVGYIGEQLDLFLVNRNIGTLWYGIGKPDESTYMNQQFVIMIAIHKVNNPSLYRKDMFKAKRKPIEEIWEGDTLSIGEVARFAPSACNTQPWFVVNDNSKLSVYRYKKEGKRGIMPFKLVGYYNRIDIGIYLLILELCMLEKGFKINRTLFTDSIATEKEYTKVAEYLLSDN